VPDGGRDGGQDQPGAEGRRLSLATSRSAGSAVLAAVTLLSAGAATGFLLRPATAPDTLQAASEVTSAPVGREELTDEHTVKISLQRSSAPPLVVDIDGRVTSTSCKAGEALTSGQMVARINNTPLIALATAAPLYRNLKQGDKGDDVTALRRELLRLGYEVGTGATFDSRTAAAVKKLQKAAGVDSPDGAVTSGQILWLPAPSVTPDSCELVQGAYVSSGQTFAKVPARLTAIVVKSSPPHTVAGDRVVDVMGVTGPLNKDGTATDAEFLAKVAGTPEYRLIEASDKDPDLTAVTTLKDHLKTLKVPPGALFGVDRDSGCVQSDTNAYAVKIVGSRLGATLVVPTGDAPAHVNLGSSITLNSCG
jgi:peptidoglycan hydrolase-like protein with peptidoglycan-binding domain